MHSLLADTCSQGVAFAPLEYRLELRTLPSVLGENLTWIPFL
jgi:hypothetical protein